MRKGNCDRCKSKPKCRKPCRKVEQDLKRRERGQKKESIRIVYHHQMTKGTKGKYDRIVEGKEDGEE